MGATVAEASKILADAIKNSEEYKNYKQCQYELKKNPQMETTVNELRRYNFELQNAEGVSDMYDEVAKIYDRFASVRKNTAARRYLRAEMSLCRMTQEMVRNIFDEIDIDLDFIE